MKKIFFMLLLFHSFLLHTEESKKRGILAHVSDAAINTHHNTSRTKEMIGSVAIPQEPQPPQPLSFNKEILKKNAQKDPVVRIKNATDTQEQEQEQEQKDDKNALTLKQEAKKTLTEHDKQAKNNKQTELTQEEFEILKKQEEADQLVNFYFEDASLDNLVKYIEDLFKIKFFCDDDITPTPQGGAVLKGHKLTFKTNTLISREEAWNLFLKFLDVAGLTVIPTETETIYRITTVTNANKEVVPTYFNTALDTLPCNSAKIRYVFFVKNSSLKTIQNIVASFASSTAAPVQVFPDLNALILIDKSSNICSLMRIVKEFDKEIPESMMVIKLKRADAQDVANLYQSLMQTESPKSAAQALSQRNQSKSLYFPTDARIIPEPRTNSLVVLGPKNALDKIATFIKEHVDVELNVPYSPLHIYELQHTRAESIAALLNATAGQFGTGTTAGQYGGVRDGNQYFGPMTITPDVSGNRLIIKAEKNDFSKLKEIIQQLDVPQPQVAIEVLIVDVQTDENKVLGSQFRNKSENFAKNTDFQKSGYPLSGGWSSPVVNASDGSLLGNLISLAASANNSAGSTVLSIGKQASGVWGIFNLLQTTSKTDVIANPFLMTTNNYNASVSLGTTRQIAATEIYTGGSSTPVRGLSAQNANLQVSITPQISFDHTIQMSINITIEDFTDADLTNGNTVKKVINTAAIVQNREVLVLGGIIKNKISHTLTKVPVLGDIPLLGWIFKSKSKTQVQSNLLIFISPQVFYPDMTDSISHYIRHKTEGANLDLNLSGGFDSSKDPINRFFFDDRVLQTAESIKDFTEQTHNNTFGTTDASQKRVDQALQNETVFKEKKQRKKTRRARALRRGKS